MTRSDDSKPNCEPKKAEDRAASVQPKSGKEVYKVGDGSENGPDTKSDQQPAAGVLATELLPRL